MPSCLVIQHVEPERSFAIGEALTAAAIEVVVCRVFAEDPLPEHIVGFDGLVVMGGPMSAGSDTGFPTRCREVALLAEAVRLERPTLGVCLGAQLLAAAGRGRVVAGASGAEIGWGPVWLDPAADDDDLLSGSPRELTVLHWHGETFEVPPGATHLASSARYRQAFRIGRRAWGLQFHIEVDAGVVDAWLAAFGHEVSAAGLSAAQIRRATPSALVALEPFRLELLGRFATLIAQPPPTHQEER